MDTNDRKILNIINASIPFVSRPWQDAARRTGLSEDEVIARIRSLKDQGIIRRIGATISPKALGWYSTLCAAQVPEDRIDEFAAAVNAFDEVTHNYVRSGSPNCWFTLITPDHATCLAIMEQIGKKTGIQINEYPSTKVFKVKASFKLD